MKTLSPREEQAAVLQRLDHIERERIAAGRDRADRAVGVVEGCPW